MIPRRAPVAAALALTALSGSAAAELIYATTEFGTLVSWDSADPTNLLSGTPVSGLAANEVIRGIDFRPADGQLYALGSFSNLYTVDVDTGAATLVGAGGFTPGLDGSSFGFDFNPTIDRIRVVSDTDQNLVLNPNDGTATGVTDLFYAAGDANAGADPNVVASAYTNSFAGAATTQLYGIDSGLDILVTQANSAGTLNTVGSLGADVTDVAGFDISGLSGTAYIVALGASDSQSTFWTIDLSTGLVSLVGEVGGGALINSMTVVPAPAGVLALAAPGLLALRRRR